MVLSMNNTMAKYLLNSLLFSVFLIGMVAGANAQSLLKASLSIPANAGILSETCDGPYALIFERGEDNTETTEIFLSDLGVAQGTLDYNFPPGSFPLQMLPTDTIVIIPVFVVDDGLPEGIESLIWEIAFLAGIESDVINIESAIADKYEVEINAPSDTIEWCRYAPLQLMATSSSEITWSPTFYFEDPIGSEVTASPFLSGWIYAAVGNEDCEVKDSVYLDLAIVEIDGEDTLYICLLNEGITLQGSLQGPASGFQWIPSDDGSLSDPNSLTPLANPVLTTTYILQSDFGVCIASDTVTVRVDSLPEDLHIDIAPLKPYYCAGEIVALFSPSFDSLAFPDMTYQWSPDNNTYLTSQMLLNAALELQDTTWYVRENINNACVSEDSILINVVPSSVPLSVTDTVLCPGAQFDVVVLSNQVTEPEWTPADGLSCTKCLDPTVTVIGQPGSTVVYQFSGMINECPVGAALPIQIPPIQVINVAGDNNLCTGDMTQLNVTNPADLSGYNWTVLSGNGSLSCTNCPNPIVTVSGMAAVVLSVTANTSNEAFCGAAGSFSITIGVREQVPGIEFITCLGIPIEISTGNPNYMNPTWSVIGGDLELSCDDCDNPVVTANSVGTIRFLAEIDDPDTCSVSGTVFIDIYPREGMQLLSIMPDPISNPIPQGSEVTVFLGANPTSILWTVNGASATSSENSITFNAENQTNFISAEFINVYGCLQIDTISFTTVPPSYKIPNAFTPNNDDLNDKFRVILNGNITVEKFMVFNRWGQKVYDVEEGSPDGWDGQFKSEPAASDTYVYTATLRYPDGRSEVAKGDVMLIR